MHADHSARAQKDLEAAGRIAKAANSEFVGTEHILLGLLEDGDGVAQRLLARHGVSRERAFDAVAKIVTAAALNPTVTLGTRPLSPRARHALMLAKARADTRSGPERGLVDTDNLLLGLLLETEGIAYQALRDMGVNLGALHRDIERVFPTSAGPEPAPATAAAAPPPCRHMVLSFHSGGFMVYCAGCKAYWIAGKTVMGGMEFDHARGQSGLGPEDVRRAPQ